MEPGGMMPKPFVLTAEQASEVYAVLVDQAGAPEVLRDQFIHDMQRHGLDEWRFQGHLRFGGKVRHRREIPDMDVIYVDCCREDLTPEYKAIIDATNATLNGVVAAWNQRGPHGA